MKTMIISCSTLLRDDKSAHRIVVVHPKYATDFACHQFMTCGTGNQGTTMSLSTITSSNDTHEPVHMHIMTAEIQSNEELEYNSISRIRGGEVTQ